MLERIKNGSLHPDAMLARARLGTEQRDNANCLFYAIHMFLVFLVGIFGNMYIFLPPLSGDHNRNYDVSSFVLPFYIYI